MLHLSVSIRNLKQISLMVWDSCARTPKEKYQIAVNNVNQITEQFSTEVIKENGSHYNSLKIDCVDNPELKLFHHLYHKYLRKKKIINQ